MKIIKKELEKYLKTHEWIDWDATINNNMTNINVTLGQKKVQKQDKMDLILEMMTEMKNDISELKKDMVEVKKDIVELKKDMVEVKKDIVELKKDMVEVKKDVSQLKAEAKKHGWNV